jgi:cell cycle sensor histidine kinase DivJ
MGAGCDRLVHPSVADEATRARHRRLIAVLITSPFLAACALSQTLFGAVGAPVTLAAIFAVFGAFWFAALVIASTGRDRPPAIAVLSISILPAGAILAGAGGLTSPLAMMPFAFALEAAWVWRTHRAVASGATAAAVVYLLGTAFGPLFAAEAGAVSAWHWLVPLAYATTLGLRFAALLGEKRNPADADCARLEDIMDAVVFRIAGSGEVVDASAKARDTLRLAPELLLGNGLFERIHVADRVQYLCALGDMREGAAHRHIELRLRMPSEGAEVSTGNYRPFTVELANQGPGVGSFVAIVRSSDVAALREALQSATEQANTIEVAKGRLLAAVSHELRTPLNAIIGFADMLGHEMCGSFSDPRQKQYVGLIKESGHHLLGVVNSILDVSKIESGAYTIHAEPFRFKDAVVMCHSMMAFQAESKAIRFKMDVSHNAGEINGDRRAIQQMLINLVSNAIKFTPDGGEVSIGVKRFGLRLHFWVRDNGIGIGADDLAQLGKPFMQVQNDYTRQFEGTGLGLSLVKGLVALHDGTMTVESAPNEGTTVTVTLPVAGPAPKEAGEQRQEIAIDTTGSNEGTDGSLRKTA